MASTRIRVNNSGPLFVEGDFEVLDGTGTPFGMPGRNSLSLCRCGHSANKPFCDGAHKNAGFNDQVVAREIPPPKPKPTPA